MTVPSSSSPDVFRGSPSSLAFRFPNPILRSRLSLRLEGGSSTLWILLRDGLLAQSSSDEAGEGLEGCKDVEGRDEPGHDAVRVSTRSHFVLDSSLKLGYIV
jgi:hypothetical protein